MLDEDFRAVILIADLSGDCEFFAGVGRGGAGAWGLKMPVAAGPRLCRSVLIDIAIVFV